MQATPLGDALRKEKIYSCCHCLLINRQKDQPSAQPQAATPSDIHMSGEERKTVDQNTGLELPVDEGRPSNVDVERPIDEERPSGEKRPIDEGKGKQTKGKAKESKLVFTFDGFRSHAKEK